MTRVLRMTHWPTPDAPVLMAVRESDMTVPPEQAVEGMLANVGDTGFFTYEIFEEVPGAEFMATVFDAGERAAKLQNDERNQAIAYLWYTQQALRVVSEGGVVMGTEPAPLSRRQMAWVLRCVAHSSAYDHQSFRVPLSDGTTIEMKNGEVLPG